MRVIGAVAVLEERAKAKTARRGIRTPCKAGEQGKAVHIHMGPGIVTHGAAGKRAESGESAVPGHARRPHGGLHASSGRKVGPLQRQNHAPKPAFGKCLKLRFYPNSVWGGGDCGVEVVFIRLEREVVLQ